MAIQTFPCSDRAKAKCNYENFDTERNVSENANEKYPFSSLLIGECFTEAIDETKETKKRQQSRLSALATINGKRYKKRFTVLYHAEYQIFEIARIS